MASLKAIRKRIASVKNTQKITKAMKMVSAAKLRRAQEAATNARAYADKLSELMRHVAASSSDSPHPLLQGREQVRRVDLILVTADRGLCGAYNSNLIRRAEQLLAQHGRDRVHVTFVGRRGFDYFKKRGVIVADKHINLFGGPDLALAQRLADKVAADYADGTTDAVFVLYSHFRSALSQVPTVEQLLPIVPASEGSHGGREYLVEPDAGTLLDRLLRQYVRVLVHRAFLEAQASEHAARMTAMDSATSNAAEMIDRLTLEMNRARQAAITKELMEIVSGAEALKG
ncbi:MAG: ATP synthase F1 subunit gamma [Candidatus Binatia bacterium]|nr:ATP synthase F1 subunit gamma [Candidatus Binatia bacterium]